MNVHEQVTLSRTLENLAKKVVALKLELPVLLALEMHLPLSTLLHNTNIFLEPLTVPFFGYDKVARFNELFGDRQTLLAFIDRVRAISAERK